MCMQTTTGKQGRAHIGLGVIELGVNKCGAQMRIGCIIVAASRIRFFVSHVCQRVTGMSVQCFR